MTFLPALLLAWTACSTAPLPDAPVPARTSPAPPAAPAPPEAPPPEPDCSGLGDWLEEKGMTADLYWRPGAKDKDQPHFRLAAITETEDGRVVYAECALREGVQWLAELGPEGLRWSIPLGDRQCCGEVWMHSVRIEPVQRLPGAWAVHGTQTYGGDYLQFDGEVTWVGWPGREVHGRCGHKHGTPSSWYGGAWVPREGVLMDVDKRSVVAASWEFDKGGLVIRERWVAGWSKRPGRAPEPQLVTATRTLRLDGEDGVAERCDAPDGHPWEYVYE